MEAWEKNPDEKSGGNNDLNEALQEKLKVLEEHLDAIEQSKKQRNLVSIVGLLLIICVHVQIMISMALPPQLQENAAKVIMHAHTTTSSRREYPFMAIF